MLIHICCSVDSHYFLEKLQEDFPNEKLIGFFYDPNIHPYSEYLLRLEDVKFSCEQLGIKLLEGAYDIEAWLQLVKGLENEPEKGDRCTVCFDRRLEVSAEKAKELGCKNFTTSLLISPKKSQDKLQIIGDKLAKKHNLNFIFKDYRAGNGLEMQGKAVKENSLYRQNYCGCLFGLTSQREQQEKLLDEMISPITNQILPESIEERIELYKKRNDLARMKKNYKIIKQRFLNYRILSGSISMNKTIIPSYFLAYSTLNNNKTAGHIEYEILNIHYLNRDETKFITLKYFNTLANRRFENIYELTKNPINFDEEIKIRRLITNNDFDLSCIVIVENIPATKIEIKLNSKIFEDVKEEIILL